MRLRRYLEEKFMTEKIESPVVGVLMWGSSSDWEVMGNAVEMLKNFNVPYEAKVVSAHRMPDEMFKYAETARDPQHQKSSSPAPAESCSPARNARR